MGIADDIHVSRETHADLVTYHDLLLQWTRTINLIAPSTISDAWDRHIVDSMQLFAAIPQQAQRLVDLGSGGGLPGLVLAIMARSTKPELAFILVESDQRKATFLRTVIRKLGLAAQVRAERIEDVGDLAADVVTARALAPLTTLLDLADQLMKSDGVALFQKGRTYADEIEAAQQRWSFDVTTIQSRTDPEAGLLEIRNIRRATSD